MSQISHLIKQRRIAAEFLALTVWKLFPNVLLVGGAADKIGFSYDFIFEQPLPAHILELIEMNLRTLIKEDQPIRFASMMRENGQAFLHHNKQPLLAEKAGEELLNIIELIQIGDFFGLCPAFSIESSLEIGHIKLFSARQEQIVIGKETLTVTRLRGTAFSTSYELKQFTKKYDHYLKKQDHRLLGRELDLFSQVEQLGELEWVWHPKGQCLRSLLQNWVEDQRKDLNAQTVATPLMIKSSKKQKLNGSQFSLITNEGDYSLSSSRLLQHAYLIGLQCHTNNSQPIRLIEYGMAYNRQPTEEKFGLLSAASALSDLLTVCCQKEQIIKELTSSLLFFEQIIRIFGFEACWYLIASPRKSAKERKEREAIEWLENAIQQPLYIYPFHSERVEEEQLAGPRLEMRIVDELQREWPAANLQIVVHEDTTLGFLQNCRHSLLIAQSVWGSLDRFVALLIERYEGKLPFWLAPEQVRVLVIGQSSQDYAEELAERCQQIGIRVKTDRRDLKLSEKVYEARREKIPYLVIIGEQEVKKGCLTLQSMQRLGKSDVLKLDDFLKQLEKEAQSPKLRKNYKLGDSN